MDAHGRELLKRVLARIEPRKAEHDPTLPSCPLCGAPALKGKGFRHPADIEHDCDCIYLRPEEYGAAMLRAWRLYTAPRLLLQDLSDYPRYREYLERPVDGHAGNRLALEAARAYTGGLLYLHGPSGTGKTHLALRLAWRLAQEGRFIRFRTELDLLKEEREAAASGEDPPFYERLVLDDLGKGRITPFTAERLYALVEGASVGRFDLIATSNFSPEELASRLGEVGEAVLSRLRAGRVVALEGRDLRRPAGFLS